jgi:hypothetical protein
LSKSAFERAIEDSQPHCRRFRAINLKRAFPAVSHGCIRSILRKMRAAGEFLLHRIRFAMTPTPGTPEKLTGIVEADEAYCGGNPRPGTGYHKRGRGTSKIPMLAVVQRDGDIRRKVVASVSSKNL